MTTPSNTMNFEAIAARFQQRLAETVARYEADIIVAQVQHEEQVNMLQSHIAELESERDNVATEDEAPAAPAKKSR